LQHFVFEGIFLLNLSIAWLDVMMNHL